MYKASRDFNPKDYPFLGANPVMIEPDYDTVANIVNKRLTDRPLTWDEAHQLCYFFVYQTRLFLQDELKEREMPIIKWGCLGDTLEENTLHNACIHASSFIYVTAGKLGLTNIKALHTSDLAKKEFTYKEKINHAFVMLTLPIIHNGRITKHDFIIDPTFRQFFADYDKKQLPSEPYYFHGRETIGSKMAKQYSSAILADHLLKFGFVCAGSYTKGLYISQFIKKLKKAIPQKWIDDFYALPSTPYTIHSSISELYFYGMEGATRCFVNTFINKRFNDPIRAIVAERERIYGRSKSLKFKGR